MVKKFNTWISEEEILSGLIQNRTKLVTFMDEINPEFFNNTHAKTIFKNINGCRRFLQCHLKLYGNYIPSVPTKYS
jgi:hypothetical protein